MYDTIDEQWCKNEIPRITTSKAFQQVGSYVIFSEYITKILRTNITLTI